MATNKSDPVAREYAKALFLLGQEKGNIGLVYEELRALDQAYRSDRGFRGFFTSPNVPSETKKRVVLQALGATTTETTKGFVTLLIHKGRESLLDNIMDAFAKHRDEAENRVHVFAESASALDAGERTRLTTEVAAATGKTVMLHETVNPAVIGGVRIRVGDALFDNTVAKRLSALSAQLMARGNVQLGSEAEDAERLFADARAKSKTHGHAHAGAHH